MGKALVEKAPSKAELASMPSCSLVSNDLRMWMFPQFFRFVQKRSSCEEVELSEGLQKNVAEVLKTPQRPLAFPIDRVGVKKSEWDVCWKCGWVGRVWKKEGREWYNNRMRRDSIAKRE